MGLLLFDFGDGLGDYFASVRSDIAFCLSLIFLAITITAATAIIIVDHAVKSADLRIGVDNISLCLNAETFLYTSANFRQG